MYRFDLIYQKLLSEQTQKKSERVILIIAIVSFLIHLLIISLVHFGLVPVHQHLHLLENPIAAIYTPFSFILIYEVYLLIFYLPRSLTTYINKQYEIILFIIIRRLFKDFSNLNISSDWFAIKYDLQFTYDLITSLLLFFLIFLFYRESRKKITSAPYATPKAEGTIHYIKLKKIIASCLVPVVVILAIYSFANWLIHSIDSLEASSQSFININNVFFEQFFSLLVITDVILLLVSFFYTDEFHKVIRNSGFIISTILIRFSFSVEGLVNNILIVTAILFGLIILVIHNQFEAQIERERQLPH